MANVWPAAREETQLVIVVPALKGCGGRSRSAYNCPLYGHALAECSKFHCELTNLGTLCGSSEEEGFADLTILVESADGFGFGEREGFDPPCAGLCGPCTHQGQRQGLKLGKA
jgi:hypothetical protein